MSIILYIMQSSIGWQNGVDDSELPGTVHGKSFFVLDYDAPQQYSLLTWNNWESPVLTDSVLNSDHSEFVFLFFSIFKTMTSIAKIEIHIRTSEFVFPLFNSFQHIFVCVHKKT